MRTGFARRGASGLTLLEIMVVVMIMGMIAAIVSKVVIDRMEVARVNTARAQIAEIMGALDMFYADNSFFPTTEQGLDALIHKPASGRVPDKYNDNGYLNGSVVPDDPWGHPYEYFSPTANGKYEVISRGADGLEGGEGYDADISSANLAAKK